MGLVACGTGDPAPGPSTDPGTPAPPAPVSTSPSATPPELAPGSAAVAGWPGAGLKGQLLQFRRDVAARRVQGRLTAANAGLMVEGLAVRAPGLSLQPARPIEAELRENAGLDLPVIMGVPDCTVRPGATVAVVRPRDGAGERRTVEVPLRDDGL